MPQPTPKQQLLQIRLGRDLSTYIAEARAAGREWRVIADDLTAVTGIKISHESLRQWFGRSAA